MKGRRGFNKNPQYLADLISRKKFVANQCLSILIDLILELFFVINFYFASARNERNKTYGWNNEPFWTSMHI
jgi:hypothetical protein